MFRRMFVALVAVLGTLAAPSAGAAPMSGADLTVGLDADGALLLPGAYYKVSVTNTGPTALTSATVVVQLDPRATGTISPPAGCPMDTAADTLTCSFGALAVGATATRTTWVVFNLPQAYTRLDATATRVASSPADPNPANDSASATCHYDQDNMGFPPHPWRVDC